METPKGFLFEGRKILCGGATSGTKVGGNTG